MTDKKTYKVLALIPRHDGTGDWFMRVGNGFTNRDDSINLYLDAIPTAASGKRMTLQIRELDARDIAQRDAARAASASRNATASAAAAAAAPAKSDSIPF